MHELADQTRRLSQEEAAEPGKWDTSRTPYLREIMECLSAHHPAHEIIFMKGAQIGGTEAILNLLNYIMQHSPGPSMVVMPTDSTAQDWSRDRLGSMIRSTPVLAQMFGSRSKDPNNTTKRKKFPGGWIKIAHATSAAELRSKPVRYLLLDEIDGYPENVDGEGDPVALAERRTSTFASMRKIFKVSTPTLESTSRIEPAFKRGDQRRYFVPCPHCDHMQTLEPEHLEWPKGKPELAKYECQECKTLISEDHKDWMLAEGEWRAQNPDAPEGVVSFHLSALYSPAGWFSWSEAASLYVEAKLERSKPKMRTVVNTIWGRTYRDAGEMPDWEKLYLRRGGYQRGTVPAGALVLTMGVDVQADRLELEVVGWGRELRSWSIEYAILPGNPAQNEVWEQLRSWIYATYPHESGGKCIITKTAIDSGFETSHVYNFCRKRDPNRVIPIKGSDSLDRAIGAPSSVDTSTTGQAIRTGLQLWRVGSSHIKEEVYTFLLQPLPEEDGPAPRGWCHWPEYDQKYFQGITAEERVYTRKGTVWQKVRMRNEPLDCRVYARAAAHGVGIDRWDDSRWDEERGFIADSAAEASRPPPIEAEAPPQPNERQRRRHSDGWLDDIGDTWL